MASGSVQHGQGDVERLLTSIVTAVATENDVDPEELDPLYDTIDPEQLVSFVEIADSSVTTSFHYCGWDVSVSGDGNVRVHQPPDNE